jgi:hypothetical protein
MKSIHPHVRITALVLLVVVSLVAGIAGTSALTAPRSGTGRADTAPGKSVRRRLLLTPCRSCRKPTFRSLPSGLARHR